jgi:misacylated tRNA(Ala) deacylase
MTGMRYFCHDHPDRLTLETRVVDARPGAVVLEQSPCHPGGGGQLPGRARLRWASGEVAIAGFEVTGDRIWHLLAAPAEVGGPVDITVDRDFRALMSQLHTDTHVLNALVFQHFAGALVTGAQLNDDGTARMDFDLPEADNDRLRALEAPINDVIRQDLPLRYDYVTMAAVGSEPGLVRNRSVAPPPTADGTVRVVEIVGLDRQACGGTHLASTAASGPIRILKIDNKGRHNRRVRIGLAGYGAVPPLPL